MCVRVLSYPCVSPDSQNWQCCPIGHEIPPFHNAYAGRPTEKQSVIGEGTKLSFLLPCFTYCGTSDQFKGNKSVNEWITWLALVPRVPGRASLGTLRTITAHLLKCHPPQIYVKVTSTQAVTPEGQESCMNTLSNPEQNLTTIRLWSLCLASVESQWFQLLHLAFPSHHTRYGPYVQFSRGWGHGTHL